MKNIFDHIEHIKKKPHHVRKRIAFTVATGGAALIALIWFIGLFGSGTFALKETSFASVSESGAAADAKNGNHGLAGVGAASTLPQAVEAPARIEIISASSSRQRQAEQTVIPF